MKTNSAAGASLISISLIAALGLGCQATKPAAEDPSDVYKEPGKEVDLQPKSEVRASFLALAKEVATARAVTKKEFDDAHALTFAKELGYDPLKALNFKRIQGSSLALDNEGLELLSKHGFVISGEHTFPHFTSGVETIYSQDLPIYVTADSILDAVHNSYDEVLKTLESQVLTGALSTLLSGLRSKLADGRGKLGTAAVDLDVYLGVAYALLEGKSPSLVAGGDKALASKLYEKAQAAKGSETVTLFGVARAEDFSQFKPRGHYEGDNRLEQYFRAMMWLGRIDLRLIETRADGQSIFRRAQVNATFALHDLFDDESLALFNTLDSVIAEMVGESDYMVLSQVRSLLGELGAKSLSDTEKLSDEQIAKAIVAGGYGEQRIASHFMVNERTVETLPLNRSFALLGQRYVLDSHVFSNVVWDRVAAMRMMPDPLDVAFAALKNDHAAQLLSEQITKYQYQGDLNAMRVIADAHGDDYWNKNLYNSWLSALRGLSPGELSEDAPTLMHTEPWGRRMLNAQLGSWAELRHDTILYAKQSYTTSAACEFPDAYVDPYPAFFAALVRYADRALDMVDRIDSITSPELSDRLRDHFGTMRSTVDRLRRMAEQQLTGTPFDAEQLAFINDAVRFDPGHEDVCGVPPVYIGWYPRLLFSPTEEFDPTIADVHTQPTDEAGNEVGRVLHVATGAPRAAIVTIDTCEGPRAYAGLVFAYHERITENFERLTDSEWAENYWRDRPADVSWMEPVVR